MNFTSIALYCYLASFGLVLIFFLIDRKKKRKMKEQEKISILIPCYNDGESIALTIKSVYDSYPSESFQLIVVNDKSTDDSFQQLQVLEKQYGFTLIDNPQNLWKSETLNNTSELAIYEKILILDADVILQKKHVHDMLARMQTNSKVAAVSCPYTPYNKGFLSIMQDMEYVMLNLIQWSYNTFGAIALRGGCFMVKKSAFIEVGKFSAWVMTEDMDLAFKLNKAGYKVEQSFHRVSTFVPDTIKTWFKQKVRWNSWGAHCFVKYPEIWIKNPLHMIMIISFNLLVLSLLLQMVKSYDLFVIIFMQPNVRKAFRVVFNPRRRLNLIFVKSSFSLLSLPYVLPLLNISPFAKKWKNLWKILLIVPYSIVYVPMYSFAGITGLFKGFWDYRKLEKIWKSGKGIAWK